MARRSRAGVAVAIVVGLVAGLTMAVAQAPPAAAADAWITANGRFAYIDQKGKEKPIPYAQVELCDRDDQFGQVTCDLMATGWTDANGNFSLGGQKGDWFNDLPDPYVQVRAYSDAVKVNTPTLGIGSSTYCFRSGNYENLGTQTLNTFKVQGGGTSSTITSHNGMKCNSSEDMDYESGAWHILHRITQAREIMRPYTQKYSGSSPNQVTVFWPDPSWSSHFIPGIQTISFGVDKGVDNGWKVRSILHEYSHYLFFKYADPGFIIPDYDDGIAECGDEGFWRLGQHCLWVPERTQIHWIEGFPAFLVEYLYQQIGEEPLGIETTCLQDGVKADLNFDACGSAEDHAHRTDAGHTHEHPFGRAEDTEGYSMAVVWDLYDSNQDNQHGDAPRDRLAYGFEPLWSTLVQHDPPAPLSQHSTTLREFITGLQQRYPKDANRISEVLAEHHITTFPAADLRVTALSHNRAGQIVHPGDEITVTDTTTNAAFGQSTGVDPVEVHAYLQKNEILKSLGPPRYVGTLASGSTASSSTGTASYRIPDDLPNGVYSVIACADGFSGGPSATVYDKDRSNNCRTATSTVELKKPVYPGPPLLYQGFDPYKQSFNSGTEPSGWDVVDHAGTGAVWRFDNPGGRANEAPFGEGQFAIADSDYYGVKNMDTSLLSAWIPLDAAPDCAEINFDTRLKTYDGGFDEYFSVDVSKDGSTWHNVWARLEENGDYFSHVQINLGVVLPSHVDWDQMRVRFHYYQANNEWYWEVDNFKVLPCIPVDRTPPPIPSKPVIDVETGGPGTGITKWNRPTFSGTSEPNARIRLYDSVGRDRIASFFASSNGTWSKWLDSPLSDGPHGIYATAMDENGNESGGSQPKWVTVDTSSPSIPSTPDLVSSSDSGKSAVDNVTNVFRPVLTGTAEPGTRVELFHHLGPTIWSLGFADTDPVTGAWSRMVPSDLPEGANGFFVMGQDVAKNYSSPSPELAVTIDRTPDAAPAAAPDLQAADDTGSSNADDVTSSAVLTLQGTAPAGTRLEVFGYSVANWIERLGVVTATASGTWSLDAEVDEGYHSFFTRVLDVADNGSAISPQLPVTVDRTAPTAPPQPILDSETGSPGTGITRVATTTFRGTGEPGASIRLRDGSTGPVVGSTAVAQDGTWTKTVDAPLTDGRHDIYATASDPAGNQSVASAPRVVWVDTVAPPAPSLPDLAALSDSGSSSTDNVTSSLRPRLTGSASTDARVEIQDRRGSTTVSLGFAQLDGAGGWSFEPTADLSPGAHGFTARASDAAGNRSAWGPELSTTIDTTPDGTPSAPKLDAADDTGSSTTDGRTRATSLTFTGTAAPGTGVELVDTTESGAAVVATAAADGDGKWNAEVAPGAGSHNYSARSVDRAGNVSGASAGVPVVVDRSAPSAAAMSPLPPFQRQLGFDLAWSATDDSAVTSYDLQRRTASFDTTLGSWKTIARGAATPTRTLTSKVGTSSCFRARARDLAGNVGAWGAATCTATPVDDRSAVATKHWLRATTAGAYPSGTITSTSAKRAQLTLLGIRGRELALLATTCPTCGSVAVSFVDSTGDVESLGTVSLSSPSRSMKQVLPLATFSAVRFGTLRLRVASSGAPVEIDGIGVLSG